MKIPTMILTAVFNNVFSNKLFRHNFTGLFILWFVLTLEKGMKKAAFL